MHRRGKARVSAPTASPACNDDVFVGLGEVVYLLAGLIVIDDCPDRHFQQHVFALFAGFVRAFAVASALRFVFRIEAEVHQRVVALAGFHDHVATLAAVAARRPAARDKLLPPERHAAIAAVACLHPNFGFINEHGKNYSLVLRRWSLAISR